MISVATPFDQEKCDGIKLVENSKEDKKRLGDYLLFKTAPAPASSKFRRRYSIEGKGPSYRWFFELLK